MAIQFDKKQGWTISASSLLAALVAVGTAYPVARNVLADEIDKRLDQKIRPIVDATKISTANTVRNLEASIAALQYKRDFCEPKPMCWSAQDQQDLNRAVTDLRTAEEVLRALNQ